jgi:hypothetical protein
MKHLMTVRGETKLSLIEGHGLFYWWANSALNLSLAERRICQCNLRHATAECGACATVGQWSFEMGYRWALPTSRGENFVITGASGHKRDPEQAGRRLTRARPWATT